MPMMKTRIVLPDKLEEDHNWLVTHMDKIEACIGSLNSADEVKALWDEYTLKMNAHLIEEEELCLPLLRTYFTPAEVAAKVQAILSNAPPIAMGSFFFWLGGKSGVMEFVSSSACIMRFLLSDNDPYPVDPAIAIIIIFFIVFIIIHLPNL